MLPEFQQGCSLVKNDTKQLEVNLNQFRGKSVITNFDYDYLQVLDGNKSFLLKLYSLIFINSNSLTNPNSFSKTRHRFSGNYYFLYNSVYFTSYSKKLNKYKLSEFFSSKLKKDKDIDSMFFSKRSIGFGKLTWYWVFRMMATNRFLINFKEYRNSLSITKFSFYETALKLYEKNYNNWLFFANKGTRDINKFTLKRKDKKIFKAYLKSGYKSTITQNNLRHKPLTDTKEKLRLDAETFKLYRRMPAYSKPSSRRVQRFRSKRILLKKNFLFSKRWRSKFIRLFRGRADHFVNEATKSLPSTNYPYLVQRGMRLFKSMKNWEKRTKLSAWRLKLAKSDYFGTATLSNTRVNYLTTNVLNEIRPSLLKNFSSPVFKDKNTFINFKFKLPLNSAELGLGYSYYTLFSNLPNETILNTSKAIYKCGHSINKDFSKNFVIGNIDSKSFVFPTHFKFKKFNKEKTPAKKESKAKVSLFSNGKLMLKKYKNLKKINLDRSFDVDESFVNKKSLSVSGAFRSKLKKKILGPKSNIVLMFYFKSKSTLSRFLFKVTTKYFNFRYLLNRVRLDHLITSIFLNSVLAKNSIYLSNSVVKNKLGLVKQSLLFKLFGIMSSVDNKTSSRLLKEYKIFHKSKSNFFRSSFFNLKFLKKNKIKSVKALNRIYKKNNIYYKNGSIVLRKKKHITKEDLYRKYRKVLKIVPRFRKHKYNFRFNTLKQSSSIWERKKQYSNVSTFKKRLSSTDSLVRAYVAERQIKTERQMNYYVGGKTLIFEKKLNLEPISPDALFSNDGELIHKYNKKWLLWNRMKNRKIFAGLYDYRGLSTYSLFGTQTAYLAFGLSKELKDKLRVMKWYSSVIKNNRLGSNINKKFFYATKSSVSCLFFKKLKKSVKKVRLPASKKMLIQLNKTSDFSEAYSIKKFRLLDYRIRFFVKKIKFLYRLKKNIKIKRKRRHNKITTNRFFRRFIYNDWWLFAYSRELTRNRVLFLKKKEIRRFFKIPNKLLFALKNSNINFLKNKMNSKYGFFRKQLKLKKKKLLKRNRRLLTFYKKTYMRDLTSRKNRISYKRRRIAFREFKRKKLIRIKRNWKKRKTRMGYYVFRIKGNLSLKKKYKDAYNLWKYSPKRRRINYSKFWKSRGFDNSILMNKFKRYSLGLAFKKKSFYFNDGGECRYYFNRFNNFSTLGLPWSYKNNDSVNLHANAFGTILPKVKYFRRKFNAFRFKKRVFFRYRKRFTFRRRKYYSKSLFFKKRIPAVGFPVKSSNSKIAYSFLSDVEPNNSDSVGNGLGLLAKHVNIGTENLKIFFSNVSVINKAYNLKLKNMALSRRVSPFLKNTFLSSKFLIGKNNTNYFSLESLSALLSKNVKNFESFDYSEIFKLADLSWKSNTVKSYEKMFSIKRRLNYRMFSLFYFFDRRETFLYRKYLATYKKQLRKTIGRSTGNYAFVKRIFNGTSVWRMQYMSSNLKTTYSVDLNKFKYNFTNHLYVNRTNDLQKKKNLLELRASLRRGVLSLVKNKLKWLKISKKSFKRSKSWSWKKIYPAVKKPFIRLRRRLYNRTKRNIYFKTSDMHDSFIGKRLIRRLRRRSFNRKRLFWSQKRFLVDIKTGNFGYFWAKLPENYVKFNTEFRKRTFQFPWTSMKPKTYFKKNRAYLWKSKNPLHARKHGQYAKRFYPRFWYKVFRRKFPLKRHRRDWALKLGKMHAMWQHKKKKQTFYDSSAVYFKNLSINSKPKRIKNPFVYKKKFKMQYVDRDLEIFNMELDPQFDRNVQRFDGPYYGNWKSKLMLRKFKSSLKTTVSWIFNPTVVTRKLSNIDQSRISLIDKQLYNVYTKRRSVFLAKKFSAYTVFLDLFKRKMLSHVMRANPLINTRYVHETKAVEDSVNDSNVSYFGNSKNKYTIVLKNFAYSNFITRSQIIRGFADESASSFNILAHKHSILTDESEVWAYSRDLGLQRYWENLLYLNTSKFRHPVFENKHKLYKIKYSNNILGALSVSSSSLNKNYKETKNLVKTSPRSLDFLKSTTYGEHQFTQKFSEFYKKNMWIFSIFVPSNGYAYATKTLV